jgi:hypothetical protein
MDRERDNSEEQDQPRRPYTAPRIIEEQEFERHALQACDKLPSNRTCTQTPRTANLS